MSVTGSLIIKDGNGTLINVSVYSGSNGFIPEHVISGAVSVTASSDFPVYVTGTVNANTPATQSVAIVNNTIANPLYSSIVGVSTVSVSSSASSSVWVTGTVNTNVSNGLKVELSGTNVKIISGSLTNTYLQVSIAAVATGSVRRAYACTGSTGFQTGLILFDWGSPASGTVTLASSSIDRKSLTISNPSPQSLYVIIGIDNPLDPVSQITNQFAIGNTSSIPSEYTFIIYPSGTYFADPHNSGLFHGGYMVSASNFDTNTRVFVTETY